MPVKDYKVELPRDTYMMKIRLIMIKMMRRMMMMVTIPIGLLAVIVIPLDNLIR